MGPVNTPVSITASGFAVGVTAPPFTVTLTPQGGGASITTTAVVTGTALGRSINFVVPPGTATGVYNLTASGAGYVSGNSLPFTVTAAPSFTISPSSGVRGATTLQVLITGTNTTFPPGSTTASFGPGISVGGGAYGSPGVVTVQSNNSAIATLTISPGATLGGRNVSVYGQDTIPQANAFMVTPAPQITGVLPDSAQQNQSQTVTITGLNTNFTSSSAVSFGLGVNVNSVTFNSPTSLSVHISVLGSAPPGARDVTVTTNGTPLTGAGLFTVLAATPQITSVFPSSAQQNQSLAVTITGLNTNFSALSTVSFGAGVTVNAVSFNSPTSLTANISVQPAATPGARDVIVTTEGVPVTGIGLFTVVGAPRILSVSPASGEQGQTLPVVITAENTSFSASSIVSFGGGITVDSFTLNGPASLIANIRIDPEAALGLRNVTVTTEGISVTGSALFSVTQAKAQQIISVAPNTGQQDQTLNVVITGLNTLFNGQSLVSFGSGVTVNSVLFNSATSLSVNLTVSAGATPGPRDVTVTTSGNPVTGSGLFSVTATPPQITSVLPSSARQSQTTSVTIIGSNTNFTNLSSVGFGAGITVNNVVFNSATSLTANITVQAAATPGLRDVTVTTSGTPVTGAALFTVLASPPQITGVSPNAAPQNQTLSVIITGSNTSFTNQSTVSFGAGITVNGVTFVNATTLNANLTVQPSAATGLRDVIVTTGGVPLTGSGLFTVQLAPAQITSVTPGSAQQGQTLNVSITGFNTTFTSGSTANFGSGVTVNSLTFISPTSLLANVTIAANAGLGARDVTVTTGGIPLTASGLFTITPSPARITSIAPNMGEQGQTFAVTIAGSIRPSPRSLLSAWAVASQSIPSRLTAR